MKTNPISLIIMIVLALLLSVCAGGSNEKVNFEGGNPGLAQTDGINNEFSTTPAPPPPPPPANTQQELQNNDNKEDVIDKKIIKTADLSLEVKDLKKSRQLIQKMLPKGKAYISEEKETNSSIEISNSLTIRILSGSFDSILSKVCEIAANIDSKNISLTDVTEEYIDIVARLKNKKEVEKQYLELLKRARTISEILEVNEYVRVLREEIESKEGRLKYLENQVSYSTINLYMYQKTEKVYRGYGQKLVDGFEGGWKGILAFLIALTYAWPLIILVFAVIWYLRKRRKKKMVK